MLISLVCCHHLASLFSVCIGSQSTSSQYQLWASDHKLSLRIADSHDILCSQFFFLPDVRLTVQHCQLCWHWENPVFLPNRVPQCFAKSTFIAFNLKKDFTPISYWCFWIEEIWVPRKSRQHLSKEFLVLTECLLNSPTNPFHKPVNGRNPSVTSARKRHKWRTLSDGH